MKKHKNGANGAANKPNGAAKSADAMRPFSRSLPMQLMRAREVVMRRFRPHLAAHGFSDQQWRIVRALNDAGSMEIGALSEECQIHAASLSRMLPKLARLGLIARKNHREDQRRVVVSITPKGRSVFRTAAPESEEIYAAMEREIGAQKLRDLYKLLDEVIESLPVNGAPRQE